MLARNTRLTTALLATALVVTLAGCSAPKSAGPAKIAPVPTTSVEPTEVPPAPEVTESTGPIYTPAAGSADRASILAAVKSGLKLTGTLTMNQLFVQGDACVGDVSTASGSRSFFALTGGPSSWTLAWSAKAGSSLATVDALVTAAPEVSADLAGKLDFAKVVTKSTTPTKAPTVASLKSFALAQAQRYAGASFTGTFTVEARIARDATGKWWGNALATPADNSLEPIGIWAQYGAGKWTGEIADFSTDNADAGFFPADVLAKLRF